jgi:hypothetical protein
MKATDYTDGRQRAEPAAEKERMTAEAILAEPVKAVNLDIPADASRELLSLSKSSRAARRRKPMARLSRNRCLAKD